MKRTITMVSVLALALSLLALPALATASTPVSDCEVVPQFFDDGPGGNVECADVGDYEFASDRYDNGA